LSAIAGAALAASSGGADAGIVFHHGPHLALPISLPGGVSIFLSRTSTGSHFSDSGGSWPRFRYGYGKQRAFQRLQLGGATLTPVRKGQVFGRGRSAPVLEVAAKTLGYFGFGA